MKISRFNACAGNTLLNNALPQRKKLKLSSFGVLPVRLAFVAIWGSNFAARLASFRGPVVFMHEIYLEKLTFIPNLRGNHGTAMIMDINV